MSVCVDFRAVYARSFGVCQEDQSWNGLVSKSEINMQMSSLVNLWFFMPFAVLLLVWTNGFTYARITALKCVSDLLHACFMRIRILSGWRWSMCNKALMKHLNLLDWSTSGGSTLHVSDATFYLERCRCSSWTFRTELYTAYTSVHLSPVISVLLF